MSLNSCLHIISIKTIKKNKKHYNVRAQFQSVVCHELPTEPIQWTNLSSISGPTDEQFEHKPGWNERDISKLCRE